MTNLRAQASSVERREIRRRAPRGFTLIELMIVVVIIGVLASLGIYSVSNYVQYTKTNEARDLLGDIMSGQEAYQGETGVFLDVSGGIAADDFYPDAGFDGTVKVQWGADDGCIGGGGRTCRVNFQMIGVMAPQPVMFRYASTTYAAGAGPDFSPWADGCEGASDPKPGYVAVAVSDLDGNGGSQSVLVGSRMQSDLCTVNLGE